MWQKLGVKFYCTINGTEPVRDWIKGLRKEDKRTIGEDIKTLQFGWPLGMPLVKNLGSRLWEIRSNLSDGKTARVIFFMAKNTIVLVNGFIKKTQKTPANEIELSKKRKAQFELEEEKDKNRRSLCPINI